MTNLKKVLSLVLVFAMVISFATITSAGTAFPDVQDSATFAPAISLLKSLDVVAGDDKGNFNPEATITRAEFSKILFVLMNGTSNASMFVGPSDFDDVSANSWYTGYINWASNENIVGGKGNGKFAPDDNVTIQEAAKMIIVALTGKSTLAWPYGFISEANKTNINLFLNTGITDTSIPAQRQIIAQMAKQAIFATDVAKFYTYGDTGTITERGTVAKNVFGLKTAVTTLNGSSADIAASTKITKTSNTQYPTEQVDLFPVTYTAATSTTAAVYGVDTTSPFVYAGDTTGLEMRLVNVYFKDVNNNNILDQTDTIINMSKHMYNKELTFKASQATVEKVLGVNHYYITDANGTKTELTANDFASTTMKEYAINGTKYVGKDINPITLGTDEGPTTWAKYFGTATDDTITFIANKSTDAAVDTKYYTILVEPTVNGGTVSALNTNITVPMVGISGTTIDGSKKMVTADGMKLVNIYDGAKVNDAVDINVKGVAYDGSLVLDITPAKTITSVLYKGFTAATAKKPAYYKFGDTAYAAASDYSNTGVNLSDLVLDEEYDITLDTAGNIVYANGAVGTQQIGEIGVVTAVSSTNGTGIQTHTITITKSDGTSKTYNMETAKLAASSGYALNVTDATNGNKWFDVDKGFLNTNGKYSTAYGTQADYDATCYLDRAVRFDVIPTSEDTIYEISTLGTAGQAISVTGYDYKAYTTNNLQVDTGNQAVSIDNSIKGFMNNGTTAYMYDTTTLTDKVYTGSDIPALTGAIGTVLVQVNKTTNESVVLAIEVSKDSPVVYITPNQDYAQIISYSIESGSQKGYQKYGVNLAVKGQIQTLYTIEEATTTTTVIKNALNTAVGNFATVQLTSDNKISAVTPVTTYPTEDSLYGWGFGYVKSTYGSYVEFGDVSAIGVSNDYSVSNVVIGSSSSYFTADTDTLVYTIDDYAPVTLTGKTFANAMAQVEPVVGSKADLTASSTYSTYMAVYHWSKDLKSGNRVLDAIYVFTTPSQQVNSLDAE
ncbi:MAG: S-layer homology domain-containing protein [Bacillota bacterium]|nr:S-layer homology domain-containing protein [Bacillota bacterium]